MPQLTIPQSVLPHASRVSAPASPYVTDWRLSTWAAKAPDRFLSIYLNMTCKQWNAMSHAQKQNALFNVSAWGDQGLTGNDVTLGGIYGPGEGGISRAPEVRVAGRNALNRGITVAWQSEDVARAIALLDQHCTGILRPSGQASPYTQTASYTNGPTLLASAVAFAAGYALAHYTSRKRR